MKEPVDGDAGEALREVGRAIEGEGAHVGIVYVYAFRKIGNSVEGYLTSTELDSEHISIEIMEFLLIFLRIRSFNTRS